MEEAVVAWWIERWVMQYGCGLGAQGLVHVGYFIFLLYIPNLIYQSCIISIVIRVMRVFFFVDVLLISHTL